MKRVAFAQCQTGDERNIKPEDKFCLLLAE